MRKKVKLNSSVIAVTMLSRGGVKEAESLNRLGARETFTAP